MGHHFARCLPRGCFHTKLACVSTSLWWAVDMAWHTLPISCRSLFSITYDKCDLQVFSSIHYSTGSQNRMLFVKLFIPRLWYCSLNSPRPKFHETPGVLCEQRVSGDNQSWPAVLLSSFLQYICPQHTFSIYYFSCPLLGMLLLGRLSRISIMRIIIMLNLSSAIRPYPMVENVWLIVLVNLWLDLTIWPQANFLKKLINHVFEIDFFVHLDEATMKPFFCEVSDPKLLFLRDMDDYIKPTNVPKR